MSDLIGRLHKANEQLIGSRESHKAIEDAIAAIKLAEDIVRVFLPIMDAARPLILNGERLRDYARQNQNYRG